MITIPKKYSRVRAWLIWTLGCLFYFYEFLLQVSPSVMGSNLMSEFSVTADGLGILSGVYFISYAGTQLPAGVLLDRLGPHRLLTIASAVCAISSIIFGMTEHFYTAVIARFFIGFGSAFAFVGSLKLVANWFTAKRFAFLTGLIVTLGMLGAVGGEAPLAYLISQVGWRHSMFFLGACGLLLSLTIFLVVQDTPEGKSVSKNIRFSVVFRELIDLLKCKQLWIIALYGGLIYMPTPTLCGLWGVPFLEAKYHIDSTMAAAMISFILFGWAIGSPIWGGYSDYIEKRKPFMIVGATLSPLMLLLIVYYPFTNLLLLQFSLFIFGFCSGSYLPCFSIAREINKPEHCGTALSFMNMINMTGVALAQPLLGHVLDHLWNGKMREGIRVYALSDYQISITIMIGIMMISIILLPFIKETYAKPCVN